VRKIARVVEPKETEGFPSPKHSGLVDHEMVYYGMPDRIQRLGDSERPERLNPLLENVHFIHS
jgi:hypothetical protein